MKGGEERWKRKSKPTPIPFRGPEQGRKPPFPRATLQGICEGPFRKLQPALRGTRSFAAFGTARPLDRASKHPQDGGLGERCRAMHAYMLKKSPCSSPGIPYSGKTVSRKLGSRRDGRVLGGRETPRRGGRWEMSGRATGTAGLPTLAHSTRGPFLAAGWDSAGRLGSRRAGKKAPTSGC